MMVTSSPMRNGWATSSTTPANMLARLCWAAMPSTMPVTAPPTSTCCTGTPSNPSAASAARTAPSSVSSERSSDACDEPTIGASSLNTRLAAARTA